MKVFIQTLLLMISLGIAAPTSGMDPALVRTSVSWDCALAQSVDRAGIGIGTGIKIALGAFAVGAVAGMAWLRHHLKPKAEQMKKELEQAQRTLKELERADERRQARCAQYKEEIRQQEERMGDRETHYKHLQKKYNAQVGAMMGHNGECERCQATLKVELQEQFRIIRKLIILKNLPAMQQVPLWMRAISTHPARGSTSSPKLVPVAHAASSASSGSTVHADESEKSESKRPINDFDGAQV